jgi:hypothetical protein
MRTSAEIQEKIDHLIAFKIELNTHFKVIELSKQKHAVLSAFYSKVEDEISLLRWVLSEVENTWSDDMSSHIDMQDYFDSRFASDFPRRPHRQERILS